MYCVDSESDVPHFAMSFHKCRILAICIISCVRERCELFFNLQPHWLKVRAVYLVKYLL